MAYNLVIVESPAKAKTIEKYLGKDYKVLASYGHVRDLVSKEGAVDPEHDFAMRYELVEKNIKHVTAIESALKKASALLLATDPDREGEAIAWHIYQHLKTQGILGDKPVHRVVFHQITRNAVQEAIEHPRDLALELVDAQQARRALDYLVGFNLSPLLWKKIRRGLSAGRVQSPALRMIVEREKEIEAFIRQEYWSLESDSQAHGQAFTGKLIEYQGQKVEQFTVTEANQAATVKATIEKAANGELEVLKVDKKQRKRNPAPPFITSTLQQEAARKLGFTTVRTMKIAQQLYEGINVGEGAVGLISYMRTDSVNLAKEAIEEIRELIVKRFGKDNLPSEPVFYRTKSKNAQEAHEAIRPTSVNYVPDEIKHALSEEQYKLYNLIWKRTVACQMIPATVDSVGVNLGAGAGHVFRANGSVISNPGFISVYQESKDDEVKTDGEDKLLPPLSVGDKVPLIALRTEQHFTEPPPRYGEASLVKALEEHGIGRPSTYASIISTLQKREYVTLEQKRFHPTDVGCVVSRFLTQHFTQYVDYDFTAKLEDGLDEISRGEKKWIPLLKEFWQPFKTQVEHVGENVQRKDVTQEAMDEACPKCQKPLSVRLGKRGRFVGCSGYPECDYTRNLDGEETTASEPEVVEGRECPKCAGALHIKLGRYGKFIGCSQYPKCKHIEPLEKPMDTNVVCPTCNKGTMLKRKSRYGKIFFSCSTYPDCQYAVWNEPLVQPCPKCHWPLTTIKTTKRRGTERVCPQKECGFAEPYGEEEDKTAE